ncbi:MAG TPA: helix-turn-helix domain-containing protein [Chiayiivirga sp.]|nr:helix-turn-helix domain-containing protein [Chiayiivirga sp.]
MSIALMAAAWKLDMPATKKLALLALADWANDEGGSLYPSIAAIAARCSVSERTVQRILRDLAEDGWLRVVGNENGGRRKTRRYQLDAVRISSSGAAKGANLAPFQDVERVTSATERVTSTTVKGAMGVTRSIIDPPERASTKKKRAPAARTIPAKTLDRPEGVSAEVWTDWLALRKAKRAPITETALGGIRREAELAGVTLESALRTCCERGWIGFKAEWITSRPVIEQGRESAAGRAARLAREGDERDARRDREGSRANHRPVIEGPRLELSP